MLFSIYSKMLFIRSIDFKIKIDFIQIVMNMIQKRNYWIKIVLNESKELFNENNFLFYQ